MQEDIRTVDKVVEADVANKKQNEESSINIENFYANIGIMGEAVEAAAVPDQQNKEAIGDHQEN